MFVDIDECSLNECDNNAKCVNTPGSFYCECIEGKVIGSPLCNLERVPLFLLFLQFLP